MRRVQVVRARVVVVVVVVVFGRVRRFDSSSGEKEKGLVSK